MPSPDSSPDDSQNRRKHGIDHSGRRGILVVARKAGVNFVQQIAAIGVAPAGAGVVIAHESVGQRALAEKRSLGAEDKAVGRIEAVPVEAEIEAVVFRIAVIDLRKQRPVIAKTGLNSEIRLDGSSARSRRSRR